ncbi:kinetochore scaffold 1 isoform X2 [Mustela putorius furo]|uniref:Kinetochore scaffold 1 n=1 Tax=Mustela putorius furo TaxID=9669 RepID=M3YAV9_MUSPF|nr:kinetochore scaffold 1 isoform X2 [Mustela putorius furo]
MDGMSSEANEENDNMDRPVRRRHSSILKPPRSPLQDLRGGNETVQESNALRNKKSSRRVSFADTIKVFQTDSHMKIARKSEIAETEVGENVLFIQSKNPEDNYCEITGMNTLLCAPIQTQMQQREISITEHNHERKHANDQTVIFSEENQMDLTTSHTIMINKGLLDCTKSEKSTKIDTTSFLANLKLHTKDSRMKKELNFSMDQSTSSEKKINFNDFIKRLKTGKSNAFPTGPDKENFEISVHPKQSNRASSVHQMHVSLKVDENSNNMTRIFREQDDGMNFTQCHTANIQTLVPTSTEASLREFKGDDITIYGNDFMDLTTNYTIQNLPSADNLSNIENQTQNVMMEVMTDYGTEDPGRKTVFKNKPNAAFQDPSLNPNGEIHITKSHITGTETHIATQTFNQDASTLAIIPGSICSSSATQDYKTFFCPSSNDAMELTKCLSGMREVKNLLKNDSNYSKTYPNPDAISLLTEKTIYSGMDNMDFTRSHTVVIDNQIFKEDHTNTQRTDTPISEKEMMLQNLISRSEDGEMNINCSSVPHVSKGRLQQSLANSLSISLTDKKTEIFTGEDMDLTKNHTANLGSQSPLISCNLISENTGKFHSHSKSPSDEWKEINKSHTEPSQQPDIISINIPTDTWSKEKDQALKTAPYLGKDSPQSDDINQDIATGHRNLDKQIELGNNRNTVSCEASFFPTTEPLFSLEGQSTMKNHNIAVNSYTVKSVSGQNSKLPEPLRKRVGNPTPDCSHNKTIICSEEEQNMDLTKSHTIVIGFGPSELQELAQHNSQMESQFLRDTICEESLKEKLKDGKITLKEFFILLQVHILIQKPRQSNLPAKFTVNTPPTPEDLMLSQYVYRPKIQIYREDCEALQQKIEELKLSALNQDKLLTDVNRNLWEKMRHCSDEELKAFGIYLNKIKSRFTKMTKVFTHQGKVALYSKLVQSVQNEREKLQIRMDEMENVLKKIENCLTEVEIETKNLEDGEKDSPMEEWDSEMRAAEKELEQLKTEEEELQRNLLELEAQKEQTLAQIDFVQKQTDRTEKLLDQLSLSEWEVIEWSDDQAVFTFLYDTIELTITFGETVVGLPFLDKAYRKIVDLNFQSLLDEDQAPPSSRLVHKLIFQYIEEQESWKKKCTTQHQVPKMLQEVSLVVSRCRLLGEEIEFLKRWGPNYNLMNIDVTNTELRLLFSSSTAFAKFEITLPLSVHFPTVPLPFSIQNHLGIIGQDEITAILSKVPLDDNYLKNVVKQIYQDLLQDCHFYHQTHGL